MRMVTVLLPEGFCHCGHAEERNKRTGTEVRAQILALGFGHVESEMGTLAQFDSYHVGLKLKRMVSTTDEIGNTKVIEETGAGTVIGGGGEGGSAADVAYS